MTLADVVELLGGASAGAVLIGFVRRRWQPRCICDEESRRFEVFSRCRAVRWHACDRGCCRYHCAKTCDCMGDVSE